MKEKVKELMIEFHKTVQKFLFEMYSKIEHIDEKKKT